MCFSASSFWKFSPLNGFIPVPGTSTEVFISTLLNPLAIEPHAFTMGKSSNPVGRKAYVSGITRSPLSFKYGSGVSLVPSP